MYTLVMDFQSIYEETEVRGASLYRRGVHVAQAAQCGRKKKKKRGM